MRCLWSANKFYFLEILRIGLQFVSWWIMAWRSNSLEVTYNQGFWRVGRRPSGVRRWGSLWKFQMRRQRASVSCRICEEEHKVLNTLHPTKQSRNRSKKLLKWNLIFSFCEPFDDQFNVALEYILVICNFAIVFIWDYN